ncbi:MAG: hypothetical protein KA521_08195 [Crocinitomicaceae bacterium]|jgi:hypothetical protein|nr:hypothetical protein [Crocinitomicaceae bacterium]
MEPTFRCGTRKAIDELAEELNLPNEKWMQDWPYEVVIASDIEKYIDHYQTLADDDKKFVLMEGIIQATEDQTSEELFLKYWERVKFILERDFNVHEFTIHYWASFDIENIEDCWKITPLMRQLWSDNAKFKN